MVKQPHLVHMYNAGMGGVDLMNCLLSSYWPSIRGKKWYWPLFSNFINLTVVAAWRLFCKANDEEISHLNSRRQINLCLLKQETTVRLRTTGGNLPMLPPEVRLDGSGHFKSDSTKEGVQCARRMPGIAAASARFVSTMTKAPIVQQFTTLILSRSDSFSSDKY